MLRGCRLVSEFFSLIFLMCLVCFCWWWSWEGALGGGLLEFEDWADERLNRECVA